MDKNTLNLRLTPPQCSQHATRSPKWAELVLTWLPRFVCVCVCVCLLTFHEILLFGHVISTPPESSAALTHSVLCLSCFLQRGCERRILGRTNAVCWWQIQVKKSKRNVSKTCNMISRARGEGPVCRTWLQIATN